MFIYSGRRFESEMAVELQISVADERMKILGDAPRRLDLEVTRSCRYKCGICSVRAEDRHFDAELSLQDFMIFVKDFAELGGTELVLTGGEPLERGLPFVTELIRFGKSLGLTVKLYTVGYSISTIGVATELKTAGLDKVYVSLEGSPEMDSLYKGVEGSYFKAIAAIEYFNEAGIEVTVHFTPVKFNFREIAHVVNVAEKLGVKTVKVIAFVAQGRGFDSRNTNGMTPQENAEFGAILAKLKETRGQVEIDFGGSPDYPPVAKPSCTIGKRGFSVTSDGRVIPCLGLRDDLPDDRFTLGSGKSASLTEIWNSPRMTQLRNASPTCGLCQTLRRPDSSGA
jgi:MoaA/NifB/PqqE/SkfB family radical SAM enzyme